MVWMRGERQKGEYIRCRRNEDVEIDAEADTERQDPKLDITIIIII